MPLRRNVLLADLPQVIAEFADALTPLIQVTPAATFAEAASQLQASAVDAAIVGYHFDNHRPYRLLDYIRNESRKPYLPLLVVRALPFEDAALSGDPRGEALRAGADGFLDLHALKQRRGRLEAGSVLRDYVLRMLGRNF